MELHNQVLQSVMVIFLEFNGTVEDLFMDSARGFVGGRVDAHVLLRQMLFEKFCICSTGVAQANRPSLVSSIGVLHRQQCGRWRCK
jgi:hypothetical protein